MLCAVIHGSLRKVVAASAVAMFGVLGVTGCTGRRRPATAGPRSSPSPSPSASPAVRAPVAGECLTDTLTTLSPFDRIQPRLRIVDCEQTHLLEVAFVGAFSGSLSPTEAPPLDGPQRRAAFSTCDAKARQFLGGDWLAGRLFVYLYLPMDDEWAAGIRYFACTIAETQLDFSPAFRRTGTLKGSLAGPAPLAITCIDEEGEIDADGFYETSSLPYVACERPHNGEFIGVTTVPDTINPDDYAQQSRVISPACWHLLSTYVGLSLTRLAHRRDIAVFWTGIFRDSVKLGEHRARCYVDVTANHLFNRSLKGLGAEALHV
jgi:hypothetical protein